MSRRLVTRNLTPLADLDLGEQITHLDDRLTKLQAEHPTGAGEIERLVQLADDLRAGSYTAASTPSPASHEDSAEIKRLAKLADELRGLSPEASTPATETDPDDRAEIDRLAALAKERA